MKRYPCLMISCALATGLAFSACSKKDASTNTKENLKSVMEIASELTVVAGQEPAMRTVGLSAAGLSNYYFHPEQAFSMRYDDSWLVSENGGAFRKEKSTLIFYNIYTIEERFVGDMNEFAELMKSNVMDQEKAKEYIFSTRQDEKYYVAEYIYEINGNHRRWTMVGDVDRQMALLFQFSSPSKEEFEAFLPDVDAMLASLDIMAMYQPDLAASIQHVSAQEIDRQRARENITSNGIEFIGKWGTITQDGDKDVRLIFHAAGTFIRYKENGDEKYRLKGYWEYRDGYLYLDNQEAIFDGKQSYTFTPEVVYEIRAFGDGSMLMYNPNTGQELRYRFLGDSIDS